ncbi:hypothetical protein CRUP_015605 [Coryphaenoides rupestris]|nr:hypothetical protein CRUP_015605 [Coryphaenoides rupestris]
MRYLADTAHVQFLGLVVGCVAWILIMATAGLNEWRLWYVPDATAVVSSGVAWVCRHMDAEAGFVPSDIVVARVLHGAGGGLRAAFAAAGSLYVLTGACSSVPLVWSITAVLANHSIDFPPEFQLPPAPAQQRVGSAVGVGMVGAVLILLCGLTFLCYRIPAGREEPDKLQPADSSLSCPHDPRTLGTSKTRDRERDNPTFDLEEVLRM